MSKLRFETEGTPGITRGFGFGFSVEGGWAPDVERFYLRVRTRRGTKVWSSEDNPLPSYKISIADLVWKLGTYKVYAPGGFWESVTSREGAVVYEHNGKKWVRIKGNGRPPAPTRRTK